MALNVIGSELQPCSYDPLTGWFRDGCCNTDSGDYGVHTVCAVMTAEFLEFSKAASPLFLFAFNRNPRSYPWPGAMETALQPFGLTVYGVTRPQDYTRAVTGLLEAIEGRIGSERSDGLSSP